MRNVQINSNFLYLCGRKMKRMTNYLEELNESQRNAVLYNDGPSLVIAGAGSGKTRVLTYKIAYLLEQGYKPVSYTHLSSTRMRLPAACCVTASPTLNCTSPSSTVVSG